MTLITAITRITDSLPVFADLGDNYSIQVRRICGFSIVSIDGDRYHASTVRKFY